MNECFLKGFGQCKRQMSREHYVSASLLEYLEGKGGFKIGGLAWQPTETLQSIGIGSLQSKILCEHHNSLLSPLDSSATRLFEALDAIDKNRSALPALISVDGDAIERWFLKVLCGMSASKAISSTSISDKWKASLTGTPWPNQCGLYVFPPQGRQVFAADFLFETMVNPATREVLAARFQLSGVIFYLLLGKPDKPAAFGVYRPRGLIFVHGQEEHRIEFSWPFVSKEAIVYRNLGYTRDDPPHRNGWNEEP